MDVGHQKRERLINIKKMASRYTGPNIQESAQRNSKNQFSVLIK